VFDFELQKNCHFFNIFQYSTLLWLEQKHEYLSSVSLLSVFFKIPMIKIQILHDKEMQKK
jgi:hypothetical protein